MVVKGADVGEEHRQHAVVALQHGLGGGFELLDNAVRHILLENVTDPRLGILREHHLVRVFLYLTICLAQFLGHQIEIVAQLAGLVVVLQRHLFGEIPGGYDLTDNVDNPL